MKEDVAIEILRRIKEVFDKYDIEYWLDYGTLLGAVRDGKFISWDTDIDLGTWSKYASSILLADKEFQNSGFGVYPINKYRIIIEKKQSGMHADIWIYHPINYSAICVSSKHRGVIGQSLDYLCRVLLKYPHVVKDSRVPAFITKLLIRVAVIIPFLLRMRIAKIVYALYEKIGCAIYVVVPSYYFRSLSTLKFYEMEFKVPDRTEEYLVYRYGKDWKVPKESYIPNEDDSAITNRKHCMKLEAENES